MAANLIVVNVNHHHGSTIYIYIYIHIHIHIQLHNTTYTISHFQISHEMIPSHFLIFVASNGSSTFLASTEALEPVLHVAVLVGGLSYFLKKRGEHDSINDEEHPEVDFF